MSVYFCGEIWEIAQKNTQKLCTKNVCGVERISVKKNYKSILHVISVGSYLEFLQYMTFPKKKRLRQFFCCLVGCVLISAALSYIQMVGSAFGVNNMKAWIHSALYHWDQPYGVLMCWGYFLGTLWAP